MHRTRQSLLGPLALVATVAVLGAACGGSDSSDSADATTTTAADGTGSGGPVVTEAGPIALAVGGRATIELSSNPTTGYRWDPTTAPDTAVVRIVEDDYVPAASDRVGSGGTQRIVVEGVAAGTTTLTLGYARPWETGVAPTETAAFTITVS